MRPTLIPFLLALTASVAPTATAKANPAAQTAPADRAGRSPELTVPIRLEAAGTVIDTEIGHAGPFVGDFDGDGVNDLLVGQFGGGVLWIYKNVGTNAAPQLAPGVKFQDGRKEGTVPTG